MRLKSTLLLASVMALTSACVKWTEPPPSTNSSSAADLATSLNDPNTLSAKSERAFRKIRLAQVLTLHKLGMLTSDLSSCFADTSSSTYWNMACGDTTTGRLSFISTAGSVTSMELESSTPVVGFGNAKETLEVTDITGTTQPDGTHSSSFKVQWHLYKDAFASSAEVCSLSSGRIYVTAKDNNLISMNTSRITVECRELETSSSSASFVLDLSGATLSPNEKGLWVGDIGFAFIGSEQQFSGSLTLFDQGLTESKYNISRDWQCLGAALCFP